METPRYFPNMNLMRYVMALGVLVAHYNTLAHHGIPFPISSYDCVGGFFALSGFLMYPSFAKAANVRTYVMHRAIRIMPPYVFTVLLCALGLSLISSLGAWEYFASTDFWRYLAANLTFLNWLHPSLPGVFEGPQYEISAVDGSLWTMKVEWCLYLSVPIVVWAIRRFNMKKFHAIVAIFIFSCIYRIIFTELYISSGKEIYNILGRQFFGQLAYFYCGMMIYFVRDWFYDHRISIFVIAFAAYLVTDFVAYGHIILSPIVLSAMFLSMSMWNVNAFRVGRKLNLSYSIYLLHFPVIQLSIYLGINDRPEWVSFGFVIVVTVALALISYYFFERPALRMKHEAT